LKYEPEFTRHSHVHYATGREKLRAHAAMLVFSLLIAGSFSLGGMAARQMDPMVLSVLRFVITSAIMAGIAIAFYRLRLSWPRRPQRFVITGILLAIYIITMFIALQYTDPVSTGAVFTLMPLMSAGFAYLFMRQTTRPGVMLSLVVAAIGAIWVIFRGDVDAILSFQVGSGEMLYFFGVAAHAAYAPLIRKFQENDHPLFFGFWINAFATFFIFVASLPAMMTADLSAISGELWLLIVYLALMATTVTFLLMQYALMRLPSSKVIGYGYLTPTTVILLEGLLGNGWASPAVIVGAAVTACGLLVMALLPD
jgi:drug/metabolite transporter (DMT)-like permease